MKGKQFGVIVLAVLILTIAASPALAGNPESDFPGGYAFPAGTVPGWEANYLSTGSYVTLQASNAMGREGGALALLGIGQANRIRMPDDFSLSSVHNGHSATFTVYQDRASLGREGGTLGILGVGQPQ